jgi:hypothetical protein
MSGGIKTHSEMVFLIIAANQNSAFLDVVDHGKKLEIPGLVHYQQPSDICKSAELRNLRRLFSIFQAQPMPIHRSSSAFWMSGLFWLRNMELMAGGLTHLNVFQRTFGKNFATKTRKASPDCYLVGEFWRESSEWVREGIFDGCTNYPLRESDHRFLF